LREKGESRFDSDELEYILIVIDGIRIDDSREGIKSSDEQRESGSA
jgi:hypothetical protein